MKKFLFFSGAISIVVIYFFLSSHSIVQQNEDVLIFTQVPSSIEFKDVDNLLLHKPVESRIVSFSKKDSLLTILTEELFAAAYPSISSDLKTLVFAAKVNENDPWQLWTMKLNGSNKIQITHDSVDCVMPTFLPNDEIIFSRKWVNELGTGFQLYTLDKERNLIEQKSFHPHTDLNSTVLKDGRVAFLSRQEFPERGEQKWMVMRPDGTKCEQFYKGPDHHRIVNQIQENEEGKLFFIERCDHGNALIHTTYANPDLSREELLHSMKETFASVTYSTSGELIIAKKPEEKGKFALYKLDVNGIDNPELFYEDEHYHSFSVVTVESRIAPKKLPSTVSTSKSSGILLCQDAHQSEITKNDEEKTSTVSYVRVRSIDDVLGDVILEPDGSFLLDLPADVPLQFQKLDQDKQVLEEASSWIWLRPNERRGCVGCHEKEGFVPENKVPLAIKQGAIKIPLEGIGSMANRTDEKGGDHEN